MTHMTLHVSSRPSIQKLPWNHCSWHGTFMSVTHLPDGWQAATDHLFSALDFIVHHDPISEGRKGHLICTWGHLMIIFSCSAEMSTVKPGQVARPKQEVQEQEKVITVFMWPTILHQPTILNCYCNWFIYHHVLDASVRCIQVFSKWSHDVRVTQERRFRELSSN